MGPRKKITWNFENEHIKAEPLKRFWLFLNSAYEANGGMRDFRDSFDTKGEAMEAVQKIDDEQSYPVDEGHIYDSANRVIVAELETRH
jgi:hypothetical protein